MPPIRAIILGTAMVTLLAATPGAFAQNSNQAARDCIARARAETDPARREQMAAECRRASTPPRPQGSETGGAMMRKDTTGTGTMKGQPMTGGTMNSMAPRKP